MVALVSGSTYWCTAEGASRETDQLDYEEHEMRKLISSFAVAAALALPVIATAGDDLTAANRAFVRGDYATAMELLKPAAEAGNRVAAETLGDLLWYGETLYGPDVRRDATAALEWYRRAARQGSPFAAHMLAAIEHNGQMQSASAAK
jgi:TPR repeat protein